MKTKPQPPFAGRSEVRRSGHRRAPASAGAEKPSDRLQVADREAHGVLGRGETSRGKDCYLL